MESARDTIAMWIAREIVPHERAVRGWLSRRWGRVVDVEDVIQEAYCRLAGLSSVDHIANPAGYYHRTAHAAATDLMRRSGIINFTGMTQIEWSNVMDSGPLADRAMEAQQELERVDILLAGLSETCRRVIELRRIEGLSRKETAECLGVSENDVKNHLVRGLQKVMGAMADEDERIIGHDRPAGEDKVETIGKRRPL